MRVKHTSLPMGHPRTVPFTVFAQLLPLNSCILTAVLTFCWRISSAKDSETVGFSFTHSVGPSVGWLVAPPVHPSHCCSTFINSSGISDDVKRLDVTLDTMLTGLVIDNKKAVICCKNELKGRQVELLIF